MATHPTDDRLSAFALGTADPADSLEIETHLGGCPDCCARLDQTTAEDPFVARVRRAAVSWHPVEPPGPGHAGGRLPATLGGYRIEGELGRGGMGTVYLAHDDRLHRAVALKTMRPDVAARAGAADRFLREARHAARVEHDHVIPIWQVGEDDGVPFIAMPYLRGESLADRLRRDPVSPLGLILRVGREVALGLAAAHDLGLIHRDVKPGNIWLEGDPRAADPLVEVRRCKILDFGLAHSLAAVCDLTAAGLTVGSPGFVAPEQARGLPVDARADLFSLGAVLYRMATGRIPFPVGGLATGIPSPPTGPNCPPALSDLILRLLAGDPAARPESARAVAEAIDRIEGAGTEAVLPRGTPAGRRGPVRRLAAVVGGLAAIVAVAAGVVIKIRQPDGKETTVIVPDGSTVTVDAKGGVGVELPKGVPAEPGRVDPDRRAAEWALRCGGRVTLRAGQGDVTVAAPQPLPAGPLHVVGIDLFGRDRLTDGGLANLAGLTRLEELNLESTPVTDAGMAHLEGLTGLTALNLADCPRVTDAGLIALRRLTRLEYLNLHGVSLSDAGLRHLDGLTGLTELNLSATPVTDAGLLYAKRFSALRTLHLANTSIGGRGLAHLAGLPHLTSLYLSDGAVTDDGLKGVAGLARLTRLFLAGCAGVGNEGMAALRGLRQLEHLNLHGTGVTDNGLRHVSALTALRVLNLSVTRVTDEGLVHLKGLTGLAELHLYKTAIRGPGLTHLDACPLARLYLSATKVTDDGLKAAAGLTRLTLLDLYQTAVTDAGLVHLKDLARLTHLILRGTKVTDDGTGGLTALTVLESLDLRETGVTGAGALGLKGLPRLRELRFGRGQVTDADVDRLRTLMPDCKITID